MMTGRCIGTSCGSLLLLLLVACTSSSWVARALASPSAPLRRLPALTPFDAATREQLVKGALEYLDASTDPLHAVHSSVTLLQAAGFEALATTESWRERIQPGGRYYFCPTTDATTLVAFAVGNDYDARPVSGGGGGLSIIGAHTDSPNLRVKPRSQRSSGPAKCRQIGVECYGGGLWHTWFDRDLGLSGRVWIREEGGLLREQRVQIDRPIMRISNLAIHLQTAKEREGFAVNKEDHLSPILALEAQAALEASAPESAKKDGWREHQEPVLLTLLAEECDVTVDQIVDFELSLHDVQKAALGGAHREFLHSARLDNLASCFMAIQALIRHVQPPPPVEETEKATEEAEADAAPESSTSDAEAASVKDDRIAMVVLYDHEEVGSSSAVGAASPVISDAVRRITASLLSPTERQDASAVEEAVATCVARSFVLSVDQAHAIHPNYAAKHEKNHQPQMNQGVVIKRNTNQRYATTPTTGVILREIARRARVAAPPQEFIVRQDCGCGSTIGPIISSQTGIRAIDVGCPQLSMHSIRETMGVADIFHGVELFEAFFRHLGEVDEGIQTSRANAQ